MEADNIKFQTPIQADASRCLELRQKARSGIRLDKIEDAFVKLMLEQYPYWFASTSPIVSPESFKIIEIPKTDNVEKNNNITIPSNTLTIKELIMLKENGGEEYKRSSKNSFDVYRLLFDRNKESEHLSFLKYKEQEEKAWLKYQNIKQQCELKIKEIENKEGIK